MKIPVNITIMTNKTVDDPQDGGNRSEERETTVNGFMHTKKNGLTLEYAEPEEGSVPVTTLIDLQRSGIVMMNRGGDAGMIFERGKTHSCVFTSGPLPVEIRVRTEALTNTISALGGKLDVDYTVDIIASRAEQSHLSLSVRPAQGATLS